MVVKIRLKEHHEHHIFKKFTVKLSILILKIIINPVNIVFNIIVIYIAFNNLLSIQAAVFLNSQKVYFCLLC